MNNFVQKFIKNFLFIFSAQSIVLIFGIVNAVVLPLILSVENFGYWQLYLLYSSFVGVFALGFNDGLYLKYGGYDYNSLPFKKLRSAIRIHLVVLILFSLLIYFTSFYYISDDNKIYVIRMICLNIIILGINGVYIYILQITNKIKQYSLFTILPKVILLLGVIFYLLLNIGNFKLLIIFDVISKTVAVLFMVYACKELWIGKNNRITESIKEYFVNVSVGIWLMLAQLMGMLVLGIGRFLVEWFGDINDFAYYSYGITITNLIIVLINSLSLIAYPTLKRLDKNDYPKYYQKINSWLEGLNVLIIFFYFCAVFFIQEILPEYKSVLVYLNILFVIIILQSKMQILNNTYYKVLRKEKSMMKANLSSIIIFIIIGTITMQFTTSVLSISLCTLVIMLWRCFVSEIYIMKVMKIKINFKKIILEIIFLLLFLLITGFFPLEWSFIMYIIFLIIYLYINRQTLSKLISRINSYVIAINKERN